MENPQELTDCALDNTKALNALTQGQKEKKFELPCCCGSVPLMDLLEFYECDDCGFVFFYSFCWKDVVQEGDTWHCKDCHTCRDWVEWHCKACNTCNYGASEPCETCGKKMPRSWG